MSRKNQIEPIVSEPAYDLNFKDILDGIEDEVLIIDTNYRLTFANAALLNKFEYSLIGRFCFEVLHEKDNPCNTPLSDCPLRTVLQTGRVSTVIHPDRNHGTDVYLKITAYPLRDANGNIAAIIQLRRDISTEKELEARLLRQHQQLLALNHISKAISASRDLDTLLGLALDNVLEIVDGTIGAILLRDKKTDVMSYRVQRGLATNYEGDLRIRLGEGISGTAAKTGEPIRLEDISNEPHALQADLMGVEGIKGFVSIPLRARSGVVGVINIASHMRGRFTNEDVSLLSSISDYLGTTIEQVALYEKLETVGVRYRALLRHTLTVQDEERKRIARELHDETSQALTSLSLSLQATIGLAEKMGIEDSEFMERLKKTHSYAIYASNEIVRLMKELRPTLLDELGMAAAIQHYAKNNLETQGIDVSAEFIGTEKRFPAEVEMTFFRVAQGIIGNILEHSGAKTVSIKLECDSNQCVLRVKDNGKGFDVSKITRVDSSGRGAGLFIMKERVSAVGGICHIDSKLGYGTDIEVKIPLMRHGADEEDKSIDS